MGYAEEYKQKLVTAEQAAAVIQDGDWVDYGWCATTNVAVDRELAKRMPQTPGPLYMEQLAHERCREKGSFHRS